MTDPKDMTVVDFAKEVLKIELFPYQVKMLQAFENGETVHFTTRSGKDTVRRIIHEYAQWKKTETIGETITILEALDSEDNR